MASLIRRLVWGRDTNRSVTADGIDGQEQAATILVEEPKYCVVASLNYLAVIILIGLPMWYYTCSVTRYHIPNVSELEHKLYFSENAPPRLHLDVSLIQLSRYDAKRIDDESSLATTDQQAVYLRTHLPDHVKTLIKNVTYNIDWRVRRPTHDENRLLDLHQKKFLQESNSGAVPPNYLQSSLKELELDLNKLHKPSNRFRLFMYLIEQPHYSAYCDQSRSHSYTISFERYIYLCPSTAIASSTSDNELIVNLANSVLDEIYTHAVDTRRINHILSSRMDLLVSLIPESFKDLNSLTNLASQLLHIYDKNVGKQYPELKELVNIRLIVQNVVDLLDDRMLNKIVERPIVKKPNSTEQLQSNRVIKFDQLDQLFNSFGSRLNKHSSRNVNNVLAIVSDPSKLPLVTGKKRTSEATKEAVNLVQREDLNHLLLVNDEKSLVLGLRAIVRGILGLSSANICRNCLVRRDVFLTRWEVDAIMGSLTLLKLHNTMRSLRTVIEQVDDIKIPKEVALKATEAYQSAIKSIGYLETKRVLEAYRSASKAYELSEEVFYDPSLLEMGNVTDYLKGAVYTPILIPLAASLKSPAKKLITFIFAHLLRRHTAPKVKIN